MNKFAEEIEREIDDAFDRFASSKKEFNKDIDGLKKEFRQGKEDWKNLTSQPGWFIAPLLLIGFIVMICFALFPN